MEISFIAAEYNPFHNGHKYHIEETKRLGADAVICIMSGNFVQRGDIAVCEKHVRAKTAILSGADLVLELPLKYAISNAELFAEGFVKTAVLTGIKGSFSFGAVNSYDELRLVNDAIASEAAQVYCDDYCKNYGVSYPAAIQKFLLENSDIAAAQIAKDGNNILALEYIRAIDKYSPESMIFCVERKGVSHDTEEIKGKYAGASYLRKKIYKEYNLSDEMYGLYSISELIPETSLNCFLKEYSSGLFPANRSFFSTALLSRLYIMDKEDIRKVNNVNHGLENRISSALLKSSSLGELYKNIKCKRYTLSRIRQVILNCALGITRQDLSADIQFIRVLGFNEKGRLILHKMKNSAAVPVIMNLSQTDKKNPSALRDAYLDYSAGKLFNICLPLPRKGNPEYDIPPIVISSS